MTRVLVTGGTGALGRELVPRLRSAGHDVRVLSRRERAEVRGAKVVRGDLTDGAGIAEATGHVDVIAHLAPKGVRMQLLDAGDAADRMTELVPASPRGRVADMGGPEVLEFSDVVRRYLAAIGKRRRIVRVGLPGKTARAFAAGHNLTPDNACGTTTWDDYLVRLT